MTLLDFEKRPVVDMSALCQEIPGWPKQLCLTLPGGSQLCAQGGLLHLGAFDYAMLALGLANTALAPLTPLFRVIDVVVSIQKTLATIPKVIGPPPRLQPLIEELAKLSEKIALVIQLMPVFSVPIMLVQMLDMFIAVVEGAAAEMTTIARHIRMIERAQIGAGESEGLAAIIKCAQSSVVVQMDNLEHLVAAINPILDIVNLFASIAQLGNPFPLPHFDGLPAGDVGADAAAEQFTLLANRLHQVRALIPI